jgi:hypothetical protein
MRFFLKSPLRGAFYHLGLLVIVGSSFNEGFRQLTGVDIGQRVFAGIVLPDKSLAVALCVSALVVLWNNWVD